MAIMIPKNNKLALINMSNHNYQVVRYYTEEQFHNSLYSKFSWQGRLNATNRDWFINWYQKEYNQSRTHVVYTYDVLGNKELLYQPYSFAYVDKDGYVTFLSAEQAYYIYNHYKKDTHKRYVPAINRHNRYSYRGTIQGRGGERYYTKMADIKYHKSLGEPKPRGGHKKNAIKNHWDEWELELRSDCANWKAHKKYRHQYEQKVFRQEKRLKRSSRH